MRGIDDGMWAARLWRSSQRLTCEGCRSFCMAQKTRRMSTREVRKAVGKENLRSQFRTCRSTCISDCLLCICSKVQKGRVCVDDMMTR